MTDDWKAGLAKAVGEAVLAAIEDDALEKAVLARVRDQIRAGLIDRECERLLSERFAAMLEARVAAGNYDAALKRLIERLLEWKNPKG